ncbi:hypothetical protein C8R44DRAFT_866354 [Mycena epipterygia]|nr:hypothetical protein C8R44DRAFT_866354 [Mycena epipterygia]
MHPRNNSEGGSKGPESRKGKEKKARRSSNMFKVLLVFIISGGTEFVGEKLRIAEGHYGIPDGVDIQTAVLEGRAVLDLNEGFEFDRTSSHEEVVDTLTALLPLAFPYFQHLQDEAGNFEPAWRLATVAKKKIVISPVVHPKGSDLDFVKGNATSGFKNSWLFIVSRKPIPTELLKEWTSPTLSSFRKPFDEQSSDPE